MIYNGPASANSTWQSKVSTGDIVCFVPGGGGGHITTCVSGSGSTAQLIDNITYGTAQGGIDNPANDGSPNDILVAAAHPASQEWAGVNAQTVVIYALDTPAVTAAATTALTTATLTLATFAHATDPAGHAITQVQAYDSLAGATLGGHAAYSAATDVTASSLAALSVAYTASGTDTLEVRAFNGTYWGDWQALSVTVSAPAPLPPKLGTQTANQNWAQGKAVSLALPATLFTDPQKGALTYSASGLKGAALPSWLKFNADTRTFSGTVPAGTTGTVGIVVTATDQAGLSASETFTATIPAVAPVVAVPTSAQIWATGSHVSDALPAGTFTDPQGQALTLRATLASGAALPSWLAFTNGVFIGTAPTTPQTLSLRVIATDTSNLSASEIFSATIAAASHGIAAEPAWFGHAGPGAFLEPDRWAVLPGLHHA